MWQFFHLSSFCFIQPLLEPIYSNFVSSLNLTISLGVSRGRKPICNSQITAVSLEAFVIKLKSIVRDEAMRDPEPGDNVFLDKFLGVYIFDVCQGLGFNPFGEIVCANQHISLVTCYFGERANNIQAPLCKRPRVG